MTRYVALEVGHFCPTFSADGRLSVTNMEAAELALIIEGIDLAGARRRALGATQDKARAFVAATFFLLEVTLSSTRRV